MADKPLTPSKLRVAGEGSSSDATALGYKMLRMLSDARANGGAKTQKMTRRMPDGTVVTAGYAFEKPYVRIEVRGKRETEVQVAEWHWIVWLDFAASGGGYEGGFYALATCDDERGHGARDWRWKKVAASLDFAPPLNIGLYFGSLLGGLAFEAKSPSSALMTLCHRAPNNSGSRDMQAQFTVAYTGGRLVNVVRNGALLNLTNAFSFGAVTHADIIDGVVLAPSGARYISGNSLSGYVLRPQTLALEHASGDWRYVSYAPNVYTDGAAKPPWVATVAARHPLAKSQLFVEWLYTRGVNDEPLLGTFQARVLACTAPDAPSAAVQAVVTCPPSAIRIPSNTGTGISAAANRLLVFWQGRTTDPFNSYGPTGGEVVLYSLSLGSGGQAVAAQIGLMSWIGGLGDPAGSACIVDLQLSDDGEQILGVLRFQVPENSGGYSLLVRMPTALLETGGTLVNHETLHPEIVVLLDTRDHIPLPPEYYGTHTLRVLLAPDGKHALVVFREISPPSGSPAYMVVRTDTGEIVSVTNDLSQPNIGAAGSYYTTSFCSPSSQIVMRTT